MSEHDSVSESLNIALVELSMLHPDVRFTLVARIGPRDNGDLSLASNDINVETVVEMLGAAADHMGGRGLVPPEGLH